MTGVRLDDDDTTSSTVIVLQPTHIHHRHMTAELA